MRNISEKCKIVIKDLKKFSTTILRLGTKIEDSRFEDFEKTIGFQLPIDFKLILKECNGIALAGVEIYGFDEKLKESSLEKVYLFEHNLVENKMPHHFLPFSPDGRGNHYCLDLSKLKDGLCPVVFWQWDYNYTSLEDVEKCNDLFLEWIEEVMINWTLEDYNFDGSRK